MLAIYVTTRGHLFPSSGTVPARSLESVENKWGPGVVSVQRYPGASHTGILKKKTYIADLIALLQQS